MRLKLWFAREEGSMMVVGAIGVVVFALLGGAALETGKWYQQRRHLQFRTDAAALAAGQSMNACFNIGTSQFPDEAAADAYIESWAKNYGGFNSAATGQTGSPYNLQHGTGSTFMSFQSDTNPSAGTPTPTRNLSPECFKDGNPSNTATDNVNMMTDVRTTQSDMAPWFSFSPLATTHGWARVQLQTIKALKPSLPLAVPDVNPLHVAVTLVDNSTGNALPGCANGCVFPLTGPTGVGQLNNWTGPVDVTMPAAGTNVGVRISMGSVNGSCAGVNSTASYTCYEYSTTGQPSPLGFVAIRSFGTAAQSGVTPALRGVTPSTCLPTNVPGGTPYFSSAQASAGNCDKVALSANVDFPAGSTARQLTYAYVLAKSNCPNNPSGAMIFQSGNTWVSSNFQTLPTGGGAWKVCLDWSYGSSPAQTGSFGAVQQIYAGSDGSDASAPGGPVMALAVTDRTTTGGVYSAAAGSTQALQVTVGITGGVHVNARCFTPATNKGKVYTCGSDPTIVLRSASTSGSLNYAINCGIIPGGSGPNNPLYQMIRYGCRDGFSINTTQVCPDPLNPTPTSCAPVQQVTGDKVGPVQSALNDRMTADLTNANDVTAGCATNNYPNTAVDNDHRIFRLVDTDFSAYTGSGGDTTVPVVTFATFYVTGWDGAVSACAAMNEPAPASAVSNGNSANIWGHFIAFSTGDGTPSGIACLVNSLAPCIAALIR